MTVARALTVQEARDEIRCLVRELLDVHRRVEAIRDGIEDPLEPAKTLMETGFIPRDEASLIRGELTDFFSEVGDQSIVWLTGALEWSRARRASLFAHEDYTKEPPDPLNLQDVEGELDRLDAWEISHRLGLTLEQIEPGAEHFADYVCTIARFKGEYALDDIIRRTEEGPTSRIFRPGRPPRSPFRFSSFDAPKHMADDIQAAIDGLGDLLSGEHAETLEAMREALLKAQEIANEACEELNRGEVPSIELFRRRVDRIRCLIWQRGHVPVEGA